MVGTLDGEVLKMRPYTVAALAERWQCSEQSIREIIRRKELPCFRAGRLIRIPAAAVTGYECGSSSIEERGMPSRQKTGEPADLRSERKIVVLPNSVSRT